MSIIIGTATNFFHFSIRGYSVALIQATNYISIDMKGY